MTYVQYIWILLSILVAVTCSFCFLQPEWFVHEEFVSCFGIYAFCVQNKQKPGISRTCGFYGGQYGFGNIPSTAWQAACLMYGGGSLFMCIAALCSLATMCVRQGVDKTLVLTTRYLQVSSVFLMTCGLLVYPIALESTYFRYFCGERSDAYQPGTCQIGWTFVLAITGTSISVFCPILSYFSVPSSSPDPPPVYNYKLDSFGVPLGHLHQTVTSQGGFTAILVLSSKQRPVYGADHKLSVIRTLVDRCNTVVTDKEDQERERAHIQNALSVCGYPKWAITKVERQINERQSDKKGGGNTKPRETDNKSKGMVVIPYIKNVSEALTRVYKKHRISVAMRPHCTLRTMLVHPKDKTDKKDVSGCVYRIPCKNCDAVYIGETGRKLSTRLSKHVKDSENSPAVFTTAERRGSQSVEHKSAVTNHIARSNHVIDWEVVQVVDREENAPLRRLRESLQICHESKVMNRDEGGGGGVPDQPHIQAFVYC